MEPRRANLFVIGAHKAGTTLFCELLGGHPDVFVSDPKEPAFFSLSDRFERGLGWYDSLFAGATTQKVLADGSTTYSQTGTYPHTVERIGAYSPGARIIYLVRDPWKRLESQWIQWRDMGLELPPTFREAVRDDPVFLDSSLYWKQVSAYRQAFPDERIRVLFFEEFIAAPAATMRTVFEFLEVDPDVEVTNDPDVVNPWRGKMEDRRLLRGLRRVPGFAWMRDRALPPGVRAALRSVFKREVAGRPQWDAATREWLAERIRDDVAALLEYAGKPPGFYEV